jgi:hypothetical protein
MGFAHIAAGNAYGFRIHSSDYGTGGTGWTLSPRADQLGQGTKGSNVMHQDYTWDGDKTTGLVTVISSTGPDYIDNKFHQFPCSKCHIPHASRLPRLMITNCLDTKKNTWDDNTSKASAIPAAGTSVGNDTVSTENGGAKFSNSTSAQNCHRLKDPAFTNAGGSGWNKVTPW